MDGIQELLQIDNQLVNCLLEDYKNYQHQSIDLEQNYDSTPTHQEINQAIEAFKQQFPHLSVYRVVELLYKRENLDKPKRAVTIDSNSIGQSEWSLNRKKDASSITTRIVSHTNEKNSEAQNKITSLITDESSSVAQSNRISEQVYSRFRTNQKKQSSAIKVDFEAQNEQNIRRMIEWKVNPDCEHRIIVNKIAPKFRSKDDELKYHQKRIAAKAFCSRGLRDRGQPEDEDAEPKLVARKPYYTWRKRLRQLYYKQNSELPQSERAPPLIFNESTDKMDEGFLNQISRHFLANGMSQLRDRRKYRLICCAFVSESYLRLEQFLIRQCGRKLRPITTAQIKALHSILLNCQQFFDEDEYATFKRFIKLTFELGSVTLYEDAARQLYIKIHTCLRNHVKVISRQHVINAKILARKLEIKAQRRKEFLQTEVKDLPNEPIQGLTPNHFRKQSTDNATQRFA